MKSAILSKSLSNNHCRRALQALGFACLAATALSHARAQTVYTWDGGTGNWSDNTMWNPTVSPNTADADVYIDNGKTGVNSVVTMDNSYTVGRLTLDAGDTLNLANNVTFTLASSFNGSESIINNGTINFNSTGNGIDLRYTGANASLTGTGTMNLTGANNRVFANNGSGDRLTIGTGATIAGTGNLGVGQSTFTNNGLVNANISGATLVLQPGGGNGSDFSNGTGGIAQASNGGVLQLFGGGTFTGGTFRALAGSAVNVGGGANVVSTTLTTVGTGTVTITDSANLNNVTLAGTINAANNSTTTLFGTLTNNGTFTLASSGNGDDLRFTGANEVLAGTGTLVLSGANDRVYATNGSGDRLTIAAQAYIDGRGNLGIGQSTFTNNGTVNANVNGQTLTLQPGSGNGSDFTNNNVAEATNGGTLALFGGGTFTGSGMFQALDGSAITIGSGTNVFSTTLSTSGSGTIVLTDTATLNNVTNNGALIAANNTTTYLTGTLTNNATFNLNSSGNGDDLRFVGSSEALAGTGTLNLNGANDRVFANGGSGDRLTIAAGATIAGTGNLGVGQSTFTNNGTVNANQSGLSLVLQPGGGQDSTFTSGKSGVTEATNGGNLVLLNGGFTGAGGFTAAAGSTLTLTGNPNVFSTTLSSTGSGTVALLDTASLTDVTTSGTVNAANNTTTYLTGTLTNNGTFNLNSSGNGDDLRFVGAQETLAGTGTLNLNGSNNRVFANGGSGDRLTIAAGATIAGTGNLGVGQSTFTNNGVVNANQSGLSLVLQPGGGQDSTFTTGVTGVTEATNGGVMVQNSGSFTNNGVYAVISGNTGGSSLSVDAGRLTNFSGTTLTGGTYNVISSNTANTSTLSFGGGTITINAANVTLSGASTVFSEINGLNNNQGSFTVANGRNFMTAGALANSGTLIAAGGSTLAVGGALTQASAGILAGNGTLSASTFTLSGRVAPGGSVSATSGAFTGGAGTLTLGGTVFLNSDANLTFELGAVSGGPNDHLNVTGALTLDGRLDVTALTGFGAGRYDLIDYTGALTNNVLDLGTLPAGYTYAIDTSLTGQVDLLVTAAVPEPATWLGGLGLLGAAGLTLRRSRVC